MIKTILVKKSVKKFLYFFLGLVVALNTFILSPGISHAAVTPLPGPANPQMYDDFNGGGTYGSQGTDWANWYNQAGGTGTYARAVVDTFTVGKFTQTPASSASQAKFEPWHYNADFSGYRYLNLSMKNPGYADSRINIQIEDGVNTYSLTNGFVAVPTTWTAYAFDLNQYPSMNKANAHVVIWLNQVSGVYGEMLVDDIKATDTYSGTAPTLTATSMTSNSGTINNENTLYTFAATYTDVDNQKPYAMQLVVDSTAYDMTEVNMAVKTYTSGKAYTYRTTLPVGNHSYYFRTTDTTSDTVVTSTISGPNVVSSTQIIDVNDNTLGTSNNQFEYVGTGWSYGTAPAGNYQLDNHLSGNTGDYLNFRFVGTQVKLYGAKASSYGIAGISIDGSTEFNVDSYSASRVESALLYTSPGLVNKTHTLKVRVTGQKNASSTGYTIAIDKANATTYTGSLVSNVDISQAGYSSAAFKNAKVTAIDALSDTTYQVLSGATVVASGNMTDEGVTWNKHVYSIDFSAVTAVGTNYTVITNGISSYPFQIQSNIWDTLKDEMTSFYRIQRASVATSVAYPTGYSSDSAPSDKVFHPAGHLDDAKSADGTVHYDLTGGWYDAGDYGKYGGNQWVTSEIALAYLRHATSSNVRYDNDNNGVPDLIDEARFSSEYLIKFANQFGGAMYDIPNNGGFVHPEKLTDNINNTADDRRIQNLGVDGSAKAAGALAATARAINSALAGGYIASAKVSEFTTFAASCQTAAVTFYNYAVANSGPADSMLFAEVELYLLTNTTAYKTSAAIRINALTINDLTSTNYWGMRPMSMAEFYPVADATTQTNIHSLLKQQADFFLSSTDDTPYGVLDQFGPFGVNEPQASYLGDMVRYYELFADPAVLRAVLKGTYWILGENPWNKSWVSGIGTDYVNFLHTRLDENSYNPSNKGIVIPGAMVSGPNMKDTKDKASVSPWYVDRGLFEDDTNQWRYNEYSISIQAGLLYTIMGLTDLNTASTSGGTVPAAIPVTSPIIGDYVRGNVTVFAQPASTQSAVDYSTTGTYSAMTPSNGVYTGTVNVSSLAPYTTQRVDVRGTDSLGNKTYSSTHYTVAPPLPDPSHPLLYENFSGGGTWGSVGLDWVNWWNQAGGTGTFSKVIVDTFNVGKFAQTPASSASQAKFEPWHDTIDLTGYRYLTYKMKNPGYANSLVNLSIEDGNGGTFSLTGGFVAVPTTWTTTSYDLNAFPTLNKKTAHLVVWLEQTTGVYGEMLIDDINATNQVSGTAPTLTATSVSSASGTQTTDFTFNATYTDADNEQPFAMEVVVDGVIHNMVQTDVNHTTYSDGKAYSYTTKLPLGTHSYYFDTTDTTSNAVGTTVQSGPAVAVLGPMAQWKFDETSGTGAADASGNGWNSTLSGGASWVAGKVNNALSFNGSTGYASTSWGQLTGNAARSIAVWFKTTSTADSDWVSWGTNASNQLSQLGIYSGNVGYLGYGNDLTTSASTYADGNWHHLAVTFDGSNMYLYVDGVLKNSQSTTLNTGSSSLNVGRAITGSNYFNGSLDELYIYGRALSTAEVQNLALTPIGYWKMDETSGATMSDASINSRNGTLSGSYSWVAGKVNNALSFNGSTGYASTSWGQLTGNAARSIAVWFKTTSTADSDWVSWGTNASNQLSQLGIYSGNIGYLGYGNDLTTSASTYADGSWHHLAVTFDGGNMYLYVDGVLKTSQSTTLNTGSSSLNIGRAITGSYYFNGTLDQLRIYSYKLSSTDVSNLYNTPS